MLAVAVILSISAMGWSAQPEPCGERYEIEIIVPKGFMFSGFDLNEGKEKFGTDKPVVECADCSGDRSVQYKPPEKQNPTVNLCHFDKCDTKARILDDEFEFDDSIPETRHQNKDDRSFCGGEFTRKQYLDPVAAMGRKWKFKGKTTGVKAYVMVHNMSETRESFGYSSYGVWRWSAAVDGAEVAAATSKRQIDFDEDVPSAAQYISVHAEKNGKHRYPLQVDVDSKEAVVITLTAPVKTIWIDIPEGFCFDGFEGIKEKGSLDNGTTAVELNDDDKKYICGKNGEGLALERKCSPNDRKRLKQESGRGSNDWAKVDITCPIGQYGEAYSTLFSRALNASDATNNTEKGITKSSIVGCGDACEKCQNCSSGTYMQLEGGTTDADCSPCPNPGRCDEGNGCTRGKNGKKPDHGLFSGAPGIA